MERDGLPSEPQFFQSLMSRFNVQGFPTILVFGHDKDSPQPYEGARTASAIESFALEQLETNVAPPEVVELSGPVNLLPPICAPGDSSSWFILFLLKNAPLFFFL